MIPHIIVVEINEKLLSRGILPHFPLLLVLHFWRRQNLKNLLTVPLITNTETENVIRTVKKVRIPPFSEVLLPGKMQYQNKITTGITEILPSAAHTGILVVGVLQDSRNDVMMCRVLNPTRHCVYLPAKFPFAFLSDSDIDLCAVGVNAVNFNDHLSQADNNSV